MISQDAAHREMLEEASDEMLAVAGLTRPYIQEDLMEGRRAIIVADSVEDGDRIHALLQDAGLSTQRLGVDAPIDVVDFGFMPRVREGDIVVVDAKSYDEIHSRMLTASMEPSCLAVMDLIDSTQRGADDIALLVSHEDAMLDALRVISLMAARFADRVIEVGDPRPGLRGMASLFGDDVIAMERHRNIVICDEDSDFRSLLNVAAKAAICERDDQSHRFDNDAWNRRQGRGKSNMRGHGKRRR